MAALNAVRRGWRHLLLPQEPQPGSPNAARGFDLEPVNLSNRASNPEPLPQVAWKKCEAETAADAAEAVREHASEAQDFLRTTIEQRPYTTAAVALGIGYLIGRFAHRDY
jgi:hypothetical protein